MMVIGKRPGVLMGVRSGQDTVAVRLGVGHGASAYPNPVKATQPGTALSTIVVRAVALRLIQVTLLATDCCFALLNSLRVD